MPLIDRKAEDMTGNEEREGGGMTRSKGLQVAVEPTATAEDSQPPYMGHTLYQLSYPGTLIALLY